MEFLYTLIKPIMWIVSWIMVGAHNFFTWIGVPATSGVNWTLSIVVLVLVTRAALIPLTAKQIKASRGMQVVQPEIKKIQQKYKGKTDPVSRQKMNQEMQAVYKRAGTNPFSSCLPVLAQSPVFFALFRVLSSLKPISEGTHDPIGPLNQAVALTAEQSTFFGAPLSSTFTKASEVAADGHSPTTVHIVTAVLIVLMSLTQFLTQRQLTMKNMPQSALDNPMAKSQRTIMYIMPLIFVISGPNFPIGVLIYWLTTNLWSMGQQFYIIRNAPAPGSEAEAKMKARQAKKRARFGSDEPQVIEVAEIVRPGQRVQPVSKARAKKGPRPAVEDFTAQKVAEDRDASEAATLEVSDTIRDTMDSGLAATSAGEPSQGTSSAAKKSGGNKKRKR